MAAISKITSKGQTTVPQSVRAALKTKRCHPTFPNQPTCIVHQNPVK